MSFNDIYEDRIVKTTVNVPVPLMMAAKKRMRDLELQYFVTYVRILIKRDVEGRNSMSLSEFLREEKGMEPQQEMFKLYRDPVRKYSGFLGGLTRNPFVNNWFQKNKVKVVDKSKMQR